MEQQPLAAQERQRIADFIALSADYIGVKPPTEGTFTRWTSGCQCRFSGPEDHAC